MIKKYVEIHATNCRPSYDSGDGLNNVRRKTKKSKMEEELEIDYYASLLWIR